MLLAVAGYGSALEAGPNRIGSVENVRLAKTERRFERTNEAAGTWLEIGADSFGLFPGGRDVGWLCLKQFG